MKLADPRTASGEQREAEREGGGAVCRLEAPA